MFQRIVNRALDPINFFLPSRPNKFGLHDSTRQFVTDLEEVGKNRGWRKGEENYKNQTMKTTFSFDGIPCCSIPVLPLFYVVYKYQFCSCCLIILSQNRSKLDHLLFHNMHIIR